MINRISIYGILGCKSCSKVETYLESTTIVYDFFDCIERPNTCNYLKLITGAYDYPIVNLVDKKIIVYLSLSYSPKKEIKNLADGFLGIGVLTVEEMIGVINDYHTK